MEWYRPAPSSVLVVDANIILSEVLGRRLRLVFQTVVANRTEVTSAHAADEVGDVARGAPGLPRGGTGELVKALLGSLNVVDEAVYADLLGRAGWALAHAAASREGWTRDAQLLACAWAFNAGLWAHDRGYVGTGWPSWSRQT